MNTGIAIPTSTQGPNMCGQLDASTRRMPA
jgi:hypothetical protein